MTAVNKISKAFAIEKSRNQSSEFSFVLAGQD
jgi:hypothetical protein